MSFDDVLKKTDFPTGQGACLWERENWPCAVVGCLECEQPFHKCLLLALWALDRSVARFPLQKSRAKHRLSCWGVGTVLSTTEGKIHCYDYHYYFIVTVDFASEKLEKKVSCIQISLDHWSLLSHCVWRMQFWHRPEFALSKPLALKLKMREPVACYIFTYFPKWDHLKTIC